MPHRQLETISRAKLKFLRSLTRRKGREEARAFLAEGVRLIADGIAGGAELLTLALHARRYDESCELQALAQSAAGKAYLATDEDFAAISDTVTSQGAVAAFAMPGLDARAAFTRERGTFLVLDNLRDPANAGLLMRHAAAFDCSGMFLLKGCCDPYNQKAVRASMGGVYTLPIETECDAAGVLESFGRHTIWTYVADNDPEAPSALGIDYAPKSAFIIGGETEGIGRFWDDASVIRVRIAQSSRIESLNAAVAASILLSHRYESLCGRASNGARRAIGETPQ